MSCTSLNVEVSQMRVVKVFLSVTMIIGMAVPSGANSQAQTQLVGVKGATVMCFVSQYLPPEVRALERQLKSQAEKALIAAGLSTSNSTGQYLTIDVSGNAVSPALCPNCISLTIVVAFSEPVRLVRAPDQRLPNSNTLDTWTETYHDVVAKSDLEAIVSSQVADAVSLFCGSVAPLCQRA